jgi:hypothetical protein
VFFVVDKIYSKRLEDFICKEIFFVPFGKLLPRHLKSAKILFPESLSVRLSVCLYSLESLLIFASGKILKRKKDGGGGGGGRASAHTAIRRKRNSSYKGTRNSNHLKRPSAVFFKSLHIITDNYHTAKIIRKKLISCGFCRDC